MTISEFNTLSIANEVAGKKWEVEGAAVVLEAGLELLRSKGCKKRG